MIITQAPVRISFFGGGTDFPEHFCDHGGTVLTTAIDRFAYITVQPFNTAFFDHRLRIAYRKTETAREVSSIEHPAVRACLEKLGIHEGVELHYMSDLPARTGLGSSSSFVVAMLQALHAYQGRFRTAQALAEEAIEVERYILQETGGFQDQIIAAFGGISLIRFERSGGFTVSHLPMAQSRVEELQRHMLLMYTGIQRNSYTVLRQQVERTAHNHTTLLSMSALAMEAAMLLTSQQPIREFGELLHENWKLKQTLSQVSLPAIDACYETGLRAGAAGGKLLGAGQGGFILFIAEPQYHERIRAALPNMPSISVGINAPGSRVIFSQGQLCSPSFSPVAMTTTEATSRIASFRQRSSTPPVSWQPASGLSSSSSSGTPSQTALPYR